MAKGSRYHPIAVGRDAVEVRQDQGVGEEDGVVEERLRHHQREAEHRAPPVVAEHRADDRRRSRRSRAGDLDRLVRLGLRRLAGLALDVAPRCRRRSPRPRRRGRASSASAGSRAGLPQKRMTSAEHRADAEAEAPADVDRRSRLGFSRTIEASAPTAAPTQYAAVDRQVDPAPHPRRDQLVDRRVDRRVLAADPRAGEEPEDGEAPEVPGEGRGRWSRPGRAPSVTVNSFLRPQRSVR